jgi:hypothetical protein
MYLIKNMYIIIEDTIVEKKSNLKWRYTCRYVGRFNNK